MISLTNVFLMTGSEQFCLLWPCAVTWDSRARAETAVKTMTSLKAVNFWGSLAMAKLLLSVFAISSHLWSLLCIQIAREAGEAQILWLGSAQIDVKLQEILKHVAWELLLHVSVLGQCLFVVGITAGKCPIRVRSRWMSTWITGCLYLWGLGVHCCSLSWWIGLLLKCQIPLIFGTSEFLTSGLNAPLCIYLVYVSMLQCETKILWDSMCLLMAAQ